MKTRQRQEQTARVFNRKVHPPKQLSQRERDLRMMMALRDYFRDEDLGLTMICPVCTFGCLCAPYGTPSEDGVRWRRADCPLTADKALRELERALWPN